MRCDCVPAVFIFGKSTGINLWSFNQLSAFRNLLSTDLARVTVRRVKVNGGKLFSFNLVLHWQSPSLS